MKVPFVIGTALHPLVCNAMPGAGELVTTLQVRLPMPFDALRQNVFASIAALSGRVVVVMTSGL